jgi:hypothetical protein
VCHGRRGPIRPALPSHEVSLAGAIGRPRLSVTCLTGRDVHLADVDFQPRISAGNQHTNGSSTNYVATLNSRNGWHPAGTKSDL